VGHVSGWAAAAAIAAIDATVVGIALPAIGREFDASLPTAQHVREPRTLPPVLTSTG
jgi:hypothetical protein